MTATAAPTKAQAAPAGRPWWLTLILGIAAVVVGAILLWAPAKTKVDTYMLLVSLLGIYWLIWGIMELVAMFIDHRQWGWKLFMGLVSIAAGSAILAYPIAAALQLPRVFVWVLGFWALFEGIILLVMAFRGGGWGAGILGVIAIGLGILLMGDATQLGSGIAMIWASAIWALIGGVVLIVHAFQARSA